MKLQTHFCLLRLGLFLFYCQLCEPFKLNSYEFPVYTTDVCPRNETEWIQRSSAINCTKSNSYICIPNENFTELLEFCYIYPVIWINKDVCLYLIKRYSRVNSYNCQKFEYGCPNKSYEATQLINYPSCTSIGNGCFRAEPLCQSITTPAPRQNVHIKERGGTIWILIFYGAFCIFCVLLISCFHNFESYTPLEKAIFEQWQQENRTFVPTKACKKVENEIKNHNLVIVTGHSGSGKSAIIQHIALKYRKQGSIVKLVNGFNEILEVCLSGKFSKKKILLILNVPIGKIFFEDNNHSWTDEEAITSCMKNIKLLISCRTYILDDKSVQGVFMENAIIVDIDNDQCKLTLEEKKQIWNIHTSNKKLTEKEFSTILKTEAYFPLLCKRYSGKTKDVINYFTQPIEFTEKEILALRKNYNKKYCALILLVYFRNELRINELLQNEVSEKKFKCALRLCGMPPNTSPIIIKDNLEYLKGFFVKKEGDTYQFCHDFVMEVTSFVFGKDFPADAIKYADIGFLQRRVKLENCTDQNEKLNIYLSDRNIDALVKRLFAALFEERFLEAILNPCLRDKRVDELLQKELEQHPEKLLMLTEKKRPKLINVDDFSKLVRSKLTIIVLGNEISPLFALIVFCINHFSLYCLKTLIQAHKDLKGSGLFPAVCCNGSKELLNVFSDSHKKEFITEIWKDLYPIHIVSLFYNSEILIELIRFGADVNLTSRNKKAWPPLMFTVTRDNIEPKDKKINQGFSCSTTQNQTIEILIQNGADVNCLKGNIDSLLYLACQNGHENIVQILLSNRANINQCAKNWESSLFIACQEGHNDIVQLLLEKGVNINSRTAEDEVSPLYIACENEHERTVKTLLDHGADVNSCTITGASPLYIACQKGYNSSIQLLIGKGAAVNMCKKNGASPLYIACRNDRYKTVQLLLSNGADVNLCRKDRTSPFYIACQNGNESLVQLLLKNGVDINICDDDGASPLFIACQQGYHKIVQLLLTNGANIDSCTIESFSPLVIACQNGHEETVRTLLQNGASINIRTKNGNSPENIALQNGHENIVQLLKGTTMRV